MVARRRTVGGGICTSSIHLFLRVAKMKRFLAVSILLNTMQLSGALYFVFSSPWGGLIDPALAEGYYFNIIPALLHFSVGIAKVFTISLLILLLEVHLWRRLPAGVLTFFLLFLLSAIIGFCMQGNFITEYQSAYAFRTPSSSLGFLNISAICGFSALVTHASAVALIGLVFAVRMISSKP